MRLFVLDAAPAAACTWGAASGHAPFNSAGGRKPAAMHTLLHGGCRACWEHVLMCLSSRGARPVQQCMGKGAVLLHTQSLGGCRRCVKCEPVSAGAADVHALLSSARGQQHIHSITGL